MGLSRTSLALERRSVQNSQTLSWTPAIGTGAIAFRQYAQTRATGGTTISHENRAIGLRSMTLSVHAVAELTRLLRDPSVPRHEGVPVRVAEAPRFLRSRR